MKDICLYGLAGAADKYRIVRFTFVDVDPDVGPKKIMYSVKTEAIMLVHHNPSIEHVYAVDNRGGLAGWTARIMKKNTIEGNVAFKDMCEREGLQII